MMVRVILVGLLLLLSLTFYYQNQDQVVTLRYFFGLQEISTSIHVPMLTAFVMGLLITSLLLFPGWIKARIELRRTTRALQEAESDMERLRRSMEKAAATHRTSFPVDRQGTADE